MAGRLDGRVAVVTGAGRGLGNAEAVALAAEGAAVVVNDLGGAQDTVKEIESAGGRAVSHDGDISDTDVANALIELAVKELGSLDIVVNNAGILRDKMIFNMTDEEWDAVIRVHLRGHFTVSRAATQHWREKSKETAGPVYARMINTASEAFMLGSPGQPNYAAAKGGIAGLTMAIAGSCARYGVRANVICPRARTKMTEDVFAAIPEGDGSLDQMSPLHVAPLVAFLASPEAERISAQLFVVYGGKIGLISAPAIEQKWETTGETWSVDEIVETVGPYLAGRDKNASFIAASLMSL